MAKISLKGTDVTTSGDIPQKGEKAPNFKLVATDLQEVNLENYTGKKKVLTGEKTKCRTRCLSIK
mgnify:CR=1 FL=1